ncbi:hypothetical protein D3C76_1875890 [compost metagenome]
MIFKLNRFFVQRHPATTRDGGGELSFSLDKAIKNRGLNLIVCRRARYKYKRNL